MEDKKAYQETEVDDITVDLTKGIFRGSKNDGSGSWFIKLTNLFKLLLRSDGSIVGATSQPQEFTNGIEATSGTVKGSVTNSQIRSGNNTTQLESTLNSDGTVRATDNTNSTYAELHSDGSVWYAGKAGSTVGGTRLYYKKFHLTSADIQSGNTTPIVLVAAAGAGTAIYAWHDTTARCVNGAVPAVATRMHIFATGGVAQPQIVYGVGFFGSSTNNPIKGDDSSGIDSDSCIIENANLIVQFDADNPLYDGTIDIYCWFEIKSL